MSGSVLQVAVGIKRQQRQGWTASADKLLDTGTRRNLFRGDGVARLWGGMVATTTTNSERVCLPCPVTGGVSTRMTQQSFVAACRAKKSRRTTTNCWGHDVAKEVFPRRCDWCKGKIECWPDELVLADVVKTKVEDKNNMTTVAGCVCDVCGKPANNKKNKSRGMTLCSSCKGIIPCVDRLDAVAAMMKRVGKTEELLAIMNPQSDMLQVIAGTIGCSVDDIIPSLQALAAHLGCGPGEMFAALYSHDHHDNDKEYHLELENHRLKREIEYLEQRKHQEPLDSALLEWARRQYEAGGIKLKITVEEVVADENN